MNPRRCGAQKYPSGRPRSFAITCAILFSKPRCLSSLNGMLFGSAQTRRAALKGCATTAAETVVAAQTLVAQAFRPAHTITTTNALETKHIHRASWGRVLLDLFHRADDAERGVRIISGNFRERDRTHPSADARVDGDVLFAVRTEIRDRVADDPRRAVELPQLRPGPPI